MGWCVWSEGTVPGRAEWRFSTAATGGRCVTTTGPSSMRRWSADSWATGPHTHSSNISLPGCLLTASILRGQSEVVLDGTFGEGVGLILLDDVHCAGSEASLLDCPHGIWGRTDCSHSEDVAVRCRARPSQETNQVPAIAPATGEHEDR